MEILSYNENNGNNNYYVVKKDDRTYVAMHVVNGKFAIYDYEFHDIVSKFKWAPNNGYACCLLKESHLEELPDLPFVVNKLIYMHLLIKEYCLKQPNDHTGKKPHVLHHINERRRDCRAENMIWVSKNVQRALLKKIGKLAKPPVEIRPVMPLLPKFCKWINAKKAFWIDSHPACFVGVEKKEQKHKYIESLKGKKWTIQQKFDDFVAKYEALMAKPFCGQESFPAFLEFQAGLENSNKEIAFFVTSFATRDNQEMPQDANYVSEQSEEGEDESESVDGETESERDE